MKKIILSTVAALILLSANRPIHAEETARANDLTVKTPNLKSQFFCGYCHILTYPNVIKKAHKSWQESKHKDVTCVTCHYPPDKIDVDIPEHGKIPKDEAAASGKRTDLEFMKTELEVLSRLVTILNMEDTVVRTRPRIDDRSCTIKCHVPDGKGKEGEFWTKKIIFSESEREDKSKRTIPYVHKTHFDKTKWVEGQEIHCTTCHQQETGQKHFEVNRQKCFLCHFKNAKLNEGRSKCSLCHEVPTKPLQRQKKEGADASEKPITHQSIQEARVQCESCHLHFIRGKGAVKQEKCRECHDNEAPVINEAANKKLMHEKHVAGQNAGCFNCHEAIEHNKNGDPLDIARNECQACHPDHHKYQKLLLLGEKREGVSNIPGLMSAVNTNCLACHIEDITIKGEKIEQGSGKACVACHTEKHEAMAKEWKDKTNETLKDVKDTEKEALKAIEAAKDKAPKGKIDKAVALVKQGQEYLSIVEYGGGVHNKKYSVMLLDVAIGNFEDAVDSLSEDDEKEEKEK
ncbi:MAG: hypothetical protein HZB61_12780 [Nitrospirae bacterium]|nr:hypothetical protein [Nitrospirota bacterium]